MLHLWNKYVKLNNKKIIGSKYKKLQLHVDMMGNTQT
jgi:hypothetical protein